MVFRYLARTLYGEEIETLTYKTLKNADFREVILEKEGKTLLKFAIANGFRNIQNLVQKLKRKRCDFDFVEVLACPSGCVNGGAQLRHAEVNIYVFVARLFFAQIGAQQDILSVRDFQAFFKLPQDVLKRHTVRV